MLLIVMKLLDCFPNLVTVKVSKEQYIGINTKTSDAISCAGRRIAAQTKSNRKKKTGKDPICKHDGGILNFSVKSPKPKLKMNQGRVLTKSAIVHGSGYLNKSPVNQMTVSNLYTC